MHIEYLRASYGDGADVAEQSRATSRSAGSTSTSTTSTRSTPPGGSGGPVRLRSPGRVGRPRGTMRRFLEKLGLPAGRRYAVLTTEVAPRPDKRAGRLPTEEEARVGGTCAPSWTSSCRGMAS